MSGGAPHVIAFEACIEVKATRDIDAVDARPPDLLTVEQAAAVLHIGRSSSYSLVREYLATNGAGGEKPQSSPAR